MICPECWGSGDHPELEGFPCPECGGCGIVSCCGDTAGAGIAEGGSVEPDAEGRDA